MAVPETLSESSQPTATKANYFAVLYFLLQGCGTLISWNAILNALDYFQGKFPGYNSFSLIPIPCFLAQAIGNCVMLKLSKTLSVNTRIYMSLISLSCLLASLPIISSLLEGKDFGYFVVLAIVFVIGFFGTIYQSTFSGLASFFPWKYTSLYLAGTGFAGLIMNGLLAISILAFGGGKTGTLQIVFYFAFAALIMATCMITHIAFSKSDFYKSHAKFIKTDDAPENDAATYDGEAYKTLINAETEVAKTPAFLEVFKQVKFFVLMLTLNYVQTFTFFPSVMRQKNTPQVDGKWKFVSMLTVFNIFDVAGKFVAENPKLCKKNIVFFVVMFRFVFAITFIWQALSDDTFLISTLAFGYINIALFAFTNGFITTASFILGPSEVEGKAKEVAGFLSIMGLTTGITIGNFLTLPFAKLNPDPR